MDQGTVLVLAHNGLTNETDDRDGKSLVLSRRLFLRTNRMAAVDRAADAMGAEHLPRCLDRPTTLREHEDFPMHTMFA